MVKGWKDMSLPKRPGESLQSMAAEDADGNQRLVIHDADGNYISADPAGLIEAPDLNRKV